MKIAIIYGSTMGNTQEVAELIKEQLGSRASDPVDVTRFDPADIVNYEALILGNPTWHIGQMQDDWEDAASNYHTPAMSGRVVALFGCGDQAGYPDTFGDALGRLWDIIEPAGPTLVGRWAVDGYSFEESAAVRDGAFLGLVCDNDSQPELTEERVEQWCQQLMLELDRHSAERSRADTPAVGSPSVGSRPGATTRVIAS